MTMPDPRLREELEKLIAKTPPERVQRLLADIRKAEVLPTQTHQATKRIQ